MIPIIGFAPDADVTTPGLISECANLVPYLNGMEGAPSPSTPSSTPPLPSSCLGAAVVARLDDTRRILAGTSNMLYELSSGAWSALGPWSRSSTATYYDATGVLQTAAINVPRITYDPTTLAYVGLLVEPASTNICINSESIGGNTGTTVSADSAVSPSGTTTADLLIESAVSSEHYGTDLSFTPTLSAQYSWSVFVKQGSGTRNLSLRIAGGNIAAVNFNFSTMSVSSSGAQFVSSSVQALPNGWFRVALIWSAASATSTTCRVQISNGGTTIYLGDGVSGFYVWGRQLEIGTTTSYIPTGATSATRSADNPVYSSGVDTRWMFAQFGDATLATNRTNNIQRSTGGSFTDIATAPKAEVIFTVGSFVMALNLNDGSEKPDGWACSAAFDDTSWTPSLATQATAGRLVATAGRLTAGMRLGEYAVAYKQRSIYLGQYVGAPTVWNWLQVPGGDAGCVGKEAICDIGGAHFFVGDDNMWIFDGTRPFPVADGAVRQWFYDNCNPQYRYRTICNFDRQKNLVWIFFPSNSSSTPDSAIVYHIVGKRWGIANRSIEAALNYVQPGVTIDGLPVYSTTIDGLAPYSFDSQFWLSGGRSMAFFDTAHQLQSLTGISVGSSMTTGEVGDDYAVTSLNSIRLRYALAPASATAQVFCQQNSGVGFNVSSSGTVLDGKFDVRATARWHKSTFTFTGPVRVTHMDADLTNAGMR